MFCLFCAFFRDWKFKGLFFRFCNVEIIITPLDNKNPMPPIKKKKIPMSVPYFEGTFTGVNFVRFFYLGTRSLKISYDILFFN